jgi:hypothetical protein
MMPFTADDLSEEGVKFLRRVKQELQTNEQLQQDQIFYGFSLYRIDADGSKVRIDPQGLHMDVRVEPKKRRKS